MPSHPRIWEKDDLLKVWVLGVFFKYFFKYFKNLFILLIFFLAVLGLHCCTRAFSSCRAQALGVRASVAAARGLSSCSMQAQQVWLVGSIVVVRRL